MAVIFFQKYPLPISDHLWVVEHSVVFLKGFHFSIVGLPLEKIGDIFLNDKEIFLPFYRFQKGTEHPTLHHKNIGCEFHFFPFGNAIYKWQRVESVSKTNAKDGRAFIGKGSAWIDGGDWTSPSGKHATFKDGWLAQLKELRRKMTEDVGWNSSRF